MNPPDLQIPVSTATVTVRIIDNGVRIGLPSSIMITPTIKGMERFNGLPAFSFLVEHPSGRKILFDLGVRHDWENLAPGLVKRIKEHNFDVSTTSKGVHNVLEAHKIDLTAIEAIIWSHWHWDHVGDPSVFPSSTTLVVGPGFKKAFMPGYPANPEQYVLESDFTGREVREISFEDLKIGRFAALDYFGDGSFFILDAPGHAIGHINALARVTAGPSSFIFMGGDSAHHGGEFRPSQYLPLPESITPHPLDIQSSQSCPGSVFEHLLRDGDRSKPFFELTRGDKGASHDDKVAEETIGKMQEADAQPRIITMLAHDSSLLDIIDVFPLNANEFVAKGWEKTSRWAFLKDFEEAVSST